MSGEPKTNRVVLPEFEPAAGSTWALRPIGIARTAFREKVEAPRQPELDDGPLGRIELVFAMSDAVCDLEAWDHLWVIFIFDRIENWRPKVQPPRSARRRGVLATRSPHRPNPIGLSVVRLERVEGCVLHVRGLDLLDGTPVIDIKPYVPYADAHPEAGSGWLEREGAARPPGRRAHDPVPSHRVEFAPRAEVELDWLAERGVELESRIEAVLALGPEPHAYRRIRRLPNGAYELKLKAWRVTFTSPEAHRIVVSDVRSGYKPKELDDPSRSAELDVHAAFEQAFVDHRAGV